MHVNTLVDEVLQIMFDNILYNDSPSIDTLGLQFSVLGVCRKWRYMALPRVYQRIFVSYSNSIYAKRRLKLGDMTTKTFTNADLAAANGCLHYCRRIVINVQCLIGRFVDLNDAVALLEQNHGCWSTATALKIRFQSLSFRNANDAELTDSAIASFAKTANNIASLLPNISKLDVRNSILDGRIDTFLKTLTGRYNQQLIWIKYGIAISAPDVVLSRLTHLNITFTSDAAEELPYFCRNTLECLRLYVLPHNQMCTLLSRVGSSPDVSFPNLKYLSISSPPCVDMSSDVKADIQLLIGQTRLHLPSLRWLYLNNSYQYCPILATAALPFKMDILTAIVSANTIMMLSKNGIPRVKQLSIELSEVGVHNSQGVVSAINQIYGNSHSIEDARLSIACSFRAFCPESISGTNITQLDISADIDMESVLGFMDILPNLCSVNINIDRINNRQTDMTVPAVNELEKHPLLPLKARVFYLRLNYERVVAGDPINNFIKYLLLRLPYLTRLESYFTFKAPISDFVDLYTPLYPHLPNARLILNPKNPWA